MNEVIAYEHRPIYVGSGVNEISESDFKELERYYRSSKSKMYSLGNRSITFKQFVGVLKVRNTTIKVLPKLGEQSKFDWNRLLFEMIKVTNRTAYRFNNVDFDLNNNILDLYIWEFAREVDLLIKYGLKKGYNTKQTNSSVMKGKILFNKDVVTNHSNKANVYIQYDDFNHNVKENSLIYTALISALKLTHNTFLQDLLKEQKLYFDLRNIKPLRDLNTISRIALNRKNIKYKDAIELSKLILSGNNPDGSNGNTNIISFLFDMNKLYEEYVFRCLKKELSKFDIEVKREIKKFWEDKIIKPDIVITKDGKSFILDTKWKDIAKHDVSDSDLKQMFVYNLYWDCEESILLYPNSSKFINMTGQYQDNNFHKTRNIEQNLRCSTYQIPLFDESGEVDSQKMIKPILDFIA